MTAIFLIFYLKFTKLSSAIVLTVINKFKNDFGVSRDSKVKYKFIS